MPELVVNGAALRCSFGAAPSSLTVLPASPLLKVGGQFLARVVDIAPMTNIGPFGMCSSLANPQVAAATSAAMGVLTPQPCIPVPAGPWTPGSAKLRAGGIPVLTSSSTCSCSWGGVIQITQAGQVNVKD
jgi:hypothetical protein